MRYRRDLTPGGTWFFTLVTYQRCPIFTNETAVQYLRDAFRKVQKKRPFRIDVAVILPDHLHFIWTLPPGDADFPTRWRLIKAHFTKHNRSPLSTQPIWQQRYWEHRIRDENDFQHHIDYIHYNPVRHGYVSRPIRWENSSFHRYVEQGILPEDWGCGVVEIPDDIGKE